MVQSSVSLLLSPFWENSSEQWVGGMLLLLSVLVIGSQALTLARRQSRRMYLASIVFLLLAGILVAPFADSRSPREFQQWLMQSQTLEMLSIVQILWTAVAVFGSIKIEIDEKKKGIGHHLRFFSIGLVSILPAPVLLLFFLWVEQNILMSASRIKPETAGIQIAGIVVIVLTLLFIVAVRFLSKYQLLGLHLLVGCILCLTCILLPSLSQGLIRSGINSTMPITNETVLLFCGMFIIVCIGLFWPKNRLTAFNTKQ